MGTTLITMYNILVKNNTNDGRVVPIVQGIHMGMNLIYDFVFMYLISRNLRDTRRCWGILPVKLTYGLITSIFILTWCSHTCVFGSSLGYYLYSDTIALPIFYSSTLLSVFMDFSTYVVLYDSMVNGYFSRHGVEEETPLV